MKKLKEVIEVEDEGMISLLGEVVTIMCGCYFYTGKLIGVNDTCVKLTDASIVYETGPFIEPQWKDAQALPNDWYVQNSAIESFGVLK